LYLRAAPKTRVQPADEEGTTSMTTPRDPGGPYERDPHDRDPHAGEGSPTWGRAPAGGWGAPAASDRYGADYDERDAGYDDRYGTGYGSEYGSEYGGESWDAPERNVEPRYGQRLDRELGDRHAEYEDAPPRAARRGASTYAPSWGRPPATGTRRAGRARGRRRLLAVGVAAGVVVVFLVLGFVTPGWFVTRVFSTDAVQAGVAKILGDAYETEGVTDVRCPERVEVVPGATFTCDATIDGDPVKIPVRVTDAKGGYQVGRPT
jgi:hypothetical protein